MDEALRCRLLAAYRWVDLGDDAAHEISDMSGWWRDPALLAALGPELAGLFPAARPTVVLGPETSGFLLGTLVARAVGAGFAGAYQDARGRLPDRTLSAVTAPDYRGRMVTLSVRAHLLTPADRVLVVDDWAATGAQLVALRAIVADAGADYLGAAVVVDGCPPAVATELGLRGLLSRRDLEDDRLRATG